MSSLPLIVIGFLLGMMHATDPDHVVAVATIVSRQRRISAAAKVGVIWGMGHTLTVFLVGGAIILFNVIIPPRVGLAMEFCVALMLIALGVITLAGVRRAVQENIALSLTQVNQGHLHNGTGAPSHLHVHVHGDYVHSHVHGHGADDHGHQETPQSWLDRRLGGLGFYQSLRPLLIGIVHGMAGSAAVALLVLAEVRDPLWAVLYLLLFGVGTIAGMMVITSAIALPFAFSMKRLPFLNLWMRLAAGVVSLVLGLYLAYQLGVVGGLFTDYPQWTPG